MASRRQQGQPQRQPKKQPEQPKKLTVRAAHKSTQRQINEDWRRKQGK
jgi:hypothetical protein